MSGATPFYCPVKLRFCVRSNSCIVVRFRPIFAENEKIRVDSLLENKRILLKNGIAFEQHKDIDCSINFFIEKARILGKNNLVKEYTNLRKKEMPECIY